jgi:hypothetical protein
VNDIIVEENVYIATTGKGLKERSVEGRFCYIRVVLLVKDKDEGGDRIR